MAKRYEQLIDICLKEQPRTIVEVGVHRAMRAVRMCQAVRGPVHYIGFDVFDTMDAEFQEAALNGKGMPSESRARMRLDELKRRKPDFTYELIVGDTRETLAGKTVKCDLAFIDGDHRVDAIASDFAAIDAPVIVLDDYYAGDNIPDLFLYGANQVAHAVSAEILPEGDTCKHGGTSYLAVVRK
jgi:hypothetical protein